MRILGRNDQGPDEGLAPTALANILSGCLKPLPYLGPQNPYAKHRLASNPFRE
jgi:hypothetical protein